MITHLNYIEDKELRDYIYDELNRVCNKGYNYVAVDDEFWSVNQSKIYGYTDLPIKEKKFWSGDTSMNQIFYDSRYIT